MIKNTAKELIITADELQNTANQLRLYASAIQRATATTEEEKRFFSEIDRMNSERVKNGATPIIPLITDNLDCVQKATAFASATISNDKVTRASD